MNRDIIDETISELRGAVNGSTKWRNPRINWQVDTGEWRLEWVHRGRVLLVYVNPLGGMDYDAEDLDTGDIQTGFVEINDFPELYKWVTI